MDGKSEWVGCDEMTKDIQDTNRTVKSVSFGEKWDSFFVVCNDDWYRYNNIPEKLHDLMQTRKRKPNLTCVSPGPEGEFYIEKSSSIALTDE